MKFVPSDAYIIMGHGKEPEFRSVRNEIKHQKVKATIPTIGTIINDNFLDNDSTFIVPDNCMIVVKSRPGEIAYLDKVVPLVNKVGDVSKQELFRNPLSDTKQLIKELGSVMVYKPGDKCPNYLYILYSPDDILQDTYMSHLGLLKTPLKTPFENKKFDNIINNDNTPVSNFIKAVYKESVYPTATEVFIKLLNFHIDSMREAGENLRQMLTSDIPWTNASDMAKFLSITQKELLQIGKDGIAKRPGVYYNFVCRAAKNINHNYFNYSNNLGKNIVNPRINSAFNRKKGTRKIIKRLIEEAEIKRKPLIRNLYTGGKRTRINRRKRGIKI
jgi:hypothetical protein